MKKYTIRCKRHTSGEYYAKEVEGREVDILPGWEFFLHETEVEGLDPHYQPWSVSEVRSGWQVARGETADKAIAAAREKVLADPERSGKLFREAIEKNKTLFVAILLCLMAFTSFAQGTVADLLTARAGGDLRRLHEVLRTDWPENYRGAIPYVTNWDGVRRTLRKGGRPGIEEDRTPAVFYRDWVDTVAYRGPGGEEFYTFGWCSEREMAFAAVAWLWGYEPVIIVRGGHAFTLVAIEGVLYRVDNTYGRFEVWDYGYVPRAETALELWYNRKARDEARQLADIPVAPQSWRRIAG